MPQTVSVRARACQYWNSEFTGRGISALFKMVKSSSSSGGGGDGGI